MLDLRITGDRHPKTFTLVTDDKDAELVRIQDILEEAEYGEGDELFEWFQNHTADQFKEGVEVPTDLVGPLAELLEGDWWDQAEKVEKARVEAMEQAAGE